jgi:hypothetical protein
MKASSDCVGEHAVEITVPMFAQSVAASLQDRCARKNPAVPHDCGAAERGDPSVRLKSGDARDDTDQRRSDQSGAETAEKIFSFLLGLREDFWLTGIFNGGFLKNQAYRVFGLESLGNELADASCEAFPTRRRQPDRMVRTIVLAEFSDGDPVEGCFGLWIVEQRRHRLVPLAVRTGPALKGALDRPEKLSGGINGRDAFGTFVAHEPRSFVRHRCA